MPENPIEKPPIDAIKKPQKKNKSIESEKILKKKLLTCSQFGQLHTAGLGNWKQGWSGAKKAKRWEDGCFSRIQWKEFRCR